MPDISVRNRKLRQQLSKYKSTIAAPPTTTLTIPATAVFSIVSRAGNVALASGLTIVGPANHTIGVPALATAERHLVGIIERGSVVTINAALDLYIDSGLGSFNKRVLKGA